MFTRLEAAEFAIERGLEHANFIYWDGNLYQVYLPKDGCATCIRRSSGPAFSTGLLGWLLRDKTIGWLVSGKVQGKWMYYFDSVSSGVPHS